MACPGKWLAKASLLGPIPGFVLTHQIVKAMKPPKRGTRARRASGGAHRRGGHGGSGAGHRGAHHGGEPNSSPKEGPSPAWNDPQMNLARNPGMILIMGQQAKSKASLGQVQTRFGEQTGRALRDFAVRGFAFAEL